MTNPDQDTQAQIVGQIISLLGSIGVPKADAIKPDTSLLSDLEIDSLKMMELIEELDRGFGVNFLEAPRTAYDLRSPAAIAQAIVDSRPGNGPLRRS